MSERKDLVLEKDTVIDGDLVCGDIRCKGELFLLHVRGNIDAGNIDAWNINAIDINAGNIKAWNIDAGDIDAGDINARNIDAIDIDAGNIDAIDINAGNINAIDINAGNINAIDINARNINAQVILCESREKKSKTDKTIASMLITQRSTLARKEQMPDDTTKQVDKR